MCCSLVLSLFCTQTLVLGSERAAVPELLFRPHDSSLGLDQAGVAEATWQALESLSQVMIIRAREATCERQDCNCNYLSNTRPPHTHLLARLPWITFTRASTSRFQLMPVFRFLFAHRPIWGYSVITWYWLEATCSSRGSLSGFARSSEPLCRLTWTST